MRTEFIQRDTDVEEVLRDTCAGCGIMLKEVYDEDQWGCLEVYGDYDKAGNLVGFLCPDCAEHTACGDCGAILTDANRYSDYTCVKCAAELELCGSGPDEVCSMCGGPMMYMGTLGRSEKFRCRNCGWEFSALAYEGDVGGDAAEFDRE